MGNMMQKEIKICLPCYKIAYSVFFTAVLALIRGVTHTYEIGIALETQTAFLSAVFCADTYIQEIASRRSEVERLYPMKNRMASVFRRLGAQWAYLLLLAGAGYGMFLMFQRPLAYYGIQTGAGSEMAWFFVYLAAAAVTLAFWAMLSVTLSCLSRNLWAGIGGSLILWIVMNSHMGERIFGKWNVFSYAFRNIENGSDLSWVCGKIACIMLTAVMAAALPQIIKKRG